MRSSPTVQSAIAEALTGDWQTARAVHTRAGVWAIETIRHGLREMAAAGLIERKDITLGLTTTQSLFRRRQPHEQVQDPETGGKLSGGPAEQVPA